MKKLETELERLARSDMYPFHMPGHKRRGGAIFETDITEIDGFDNLHDPKSLLKEEMQATAAFYGTRETYFLVNGSTCGILAAISAAVPRGGRLLIPRNAHISVYHAAYLRSLELAYIEDPGADHIKADAAFITSPSYEGCTADVKAWADYAKMAKIPLIVDEAHGAHFSRHPYFPKSAIELGADLVIQSTHKTLPAMTQTALLHHVTGRADSRAIRKFLKIYESSSPSYVLMSSVTSAIHRMMEEGPAYFHEYAARLKNLRTELAGLKNLHLAGGAEAVLTEAALGEAVLGEAALAEAAGSSLYPAGTRLDPGKLWILGAGHISGYELYGILRKNYHLQPEMCTEDSVLLMTSVMDTEEGFRRLSKALREIDGTLRPGEEGSGDAAGLQSAENSPDTSTKHVHFHIPPQAMRLADAYDADAEDVLLDQAEGRISADFVIVYPPDSPLIIPGEIFTEEIIRRITELPEVMGLSSEGTVRCVK